MCEPVSLAMGTMAVAGAATSVIGQNNARQLAKGTQNQLKNAQDDVIIENRKRATHDFLRQVRLEQLQQTQETATVNEQAQDTAKQVAGAKGEAQVSAAERGVAGNNLDMILANYEFQQSQEVGRLRMNQDMKNQQHTENIAGFQDDYAYRVTAVKPYVPRTQPAVDYFGPIFGATTSIAGGNMGRLGNIGSTTPSVGTGAAAVRAGNQVNENAWTSQFGIGQ